MRAATVSSAAMPVRGVMREPSWMVWSTGSRSACGPGTHRAGEQRQHEDQVQGPRRGLRGRGGGGEVDGALEQGAVPAPGRDLRADVERQTVEAGHDAGLLEVVHAVGEHAGRDDDQHGRGPGEELGDVDAHDAARHQHTRAPPPSRCRAHRPRSDWWCRRWRGRRPRGTAPSRDPRGRRRAAPSRPRRMGSCRLRHRVAPAGRRAASVPCAPSRTPSR